MKNSSESKFFTYRVVNILAMFIALDHINGLIVTNAFLCSCSSYHNQCFFKK